MKSSNALLAVAFLLLLGLGFGGTYYLLQQRAAHPADPPRVIEPAGTKGTTPAAPVAGGTTTKPRAGSGTQKPRPPAEIRGIVTDADGKPISGVAVFLLPPEKNAPPPPSSDVREALRISAFFETANDEADLPRPLHAWNTIASDPTRFDAAELASTKSADDGSFLLNIPIHLGTGPFRVIARSETLGSASRSGVTAGTTGLTLSISTAGVVTGRVIASDGSAVKDFRLAFAGAEAEYTTQSGADGAFRVEGMPAGVYEARGGAEGLMPLLALKVTVQRNTPVEVRLPAGTKLVVRAIVQADFEQRKEDSDPVADAEIVAMEETTYAYVTGRTNSSGIVEFAGLPPGSWIVGGRAKDVVPEGQEQCVIKPGESVHDLLFTFEKAVLTPIEVTDAQGQPVVGMTWYAGDPDEEFDAVTSEALPGVTDERGRYSFAFEFMGRRAVIFGFAPGYGAVSVVPDDYQEGQAIKVTARKAGSLTGSVRLSTGEPVAGAIVVIELRAAADAKGRSSQSPDDFTIRVPTGPQGKYAFTNLPVGLEASVQAESRDGSYYSDEMEDITIAGEHTQDFTIDVTETKVRQISVGGQPVKPPTPPVPGGK